MSEPKQYRLIPTGTCWCGCGAEVPIGSFFLAGHDKKAESRVIMEVFGDVPHFLAAFGYAPPGAITTENEWQVARSARVDTALRRLDEIRDLLIKEAI